MDNEFITIDEEFGQNFINYAAAVNSDRSIPDAKTGLKPVNRRILWICYDTKRTSKKKHTKCARIVGDVMGRVHPHGDSSIYDAMVKMAQPWRMRYPLIDFHGNLGNVGGDGAAAMRYTEARMPKIVEEGIVKGLNKNIVEMIPNYDDAEEEPITLPAVFPNLLCNPNKGIGVGMASNWLPHNLKEVAKAINDYLDGKEPMLPGPDFPLGGVIINKDDIPNIMRTGKGTVRIRAEYEIENNKIIFTSIPFGTKTENLLDELQALAKEEPELGIKTTRDECGKNSQIRIIVECKTTSNPKMIVKHIFSKTSFEKTQSYNMVALVDREPRLLNLKEAIKIYVDHNIDCIIRETKFDIEKAEARKEILDGLIKALADIDDIIATIKVSKNSVEAKNRLVAKWQFTENQAKAILAMRLSSLTRLDGVAIETEWAELAVKLEEWYQLVANEDKQIDCLREKLAEIVKKYGDDRRTKLEQSVIKKDSKEIVQVVPEEVVVVTTQSGFIKRIPAKAFRVQNRGGKGIKTKDGAIMSAIKTNTIDTMMFFSNKGKMYKTIVDDIIEGTNTKKGQLLNELIDLDTDETIIAVSSLHRKNMPKYIIFITKQGLIKKSELTEYLGERKSRKGIKAINLVEGDSIVNVLFQDEENIFLITKNGMGLNVETSSIRPIGRATRGRKGIKLKDNDYVLSGVSIHKETDDLGIFTIDGKAKKLKNEDMTIYGLNSFGVRYTNGKEIAGIAMLEDNDKILILGNNNSICIEASSIPVYSSKIAEGVTVIKDNFIEDIVKI